MNVKVTVRSVQTMDGETEETVFETDGEYEKAENGARLSYRQTDENGTVNTVITVKETVCIERTGVLSSRLILEKDKPHLCPYGTPYGTFSLGVTAKEIQNFLTADGGTLRLVYRLDAGGAPIENDILITVKEVLI